MDERIAEQLAILATKLNVTVDILYTALHKQAFFYGICDIVFYVVLFSVGPYGMVRYWRWCKKQKVGSYDDGGRYILFAVMCVLMLGAILATVCSLPMTLAAFFNPDYWVLKQIWHK